MNSLDKPVKGTNGELMYGGQSLRDILANNLLLAGADLRGADLRGANLTGANLKSANLAGADLTGAELSWEAFNNVDLEEN